MFFIPANGAKELSDVLKNILKDVLKELSECQIVILEMIACDPSLSAKAMSEKMSEKNADVKGTFDKVICSKCLILL